MTLETGTNDKKDVQDFKMKMEEKRIAADNSKAEAQRTFELGLEELRNVKSMSKEALEARIEKIKFDYTMAKDKSDREYKIAEDSHKYNLEIFKQQNTEDMNNARLEFELQMSFIKSAKDDSAEERAAREKQAQRDFDEKKYKLEEFFKGTAQLEAQRKNMADEKLREGEISYQRHLTEIKEIQAAAEKKMNSEREAERYKIEQEFKNKELASKEKIASEKSSWEKRREDRLAGIKPDPKAEGPKTSNKREKSVGNIEYWNKMNAKIAESQRKTNEIKKMIMEISKDPQPEAQKILQIEDAVYEEDIQQEFDPSKYATDTDKKIAKMMADSNKDEHFRVALLPFAKENSDVRKVIELLEEKIQNTHEQIAEIPDDMHEHKFIIPTAIERKIEKVISHPPEVKFEDISEGEILNGNNWRPTKLGAPGEPKWFTVGPENSRQKAIDEYVTTVKTNEDDKKFMEKLWTTAGISTAKDWEPTDFTLPNEPNWFRDFALERRREVINKYNSLSPGKERSDYLSRVIQLYKKKPKRYMAKFN